MKSPIHKRSFWYSVLRTYTSFILYNFYDRVTVIGKNRVPTNKPIIFAINHQNALMDALTVLLTFGDQTVYMARADIFKSKIIAAILRFLKILPIFRIRDGIKNLQNNDAVFEEAIGVMEAKRMLAMLPEGNHFGERRLRALKKGIARIAFQAEERNNFELDVHIVPVGLDYTHYINFGADLLVNFGEPFSITQFKDQYLENPQKGMNAFLKHLRNQMTPQMLNIEDTEHYNEIETLKDIYINHLLVKGQLKDDHLKIIEKSQQISDKLIELKTNLSDKFEELGRNALIIKDYIKTMNLRYWVLAHTRFYWPVQILNIILLILLLPFFVFGFVTNIIPFYLPVFATRSIKDPQFVSSVRFAVSMFSFAIFYTIYLVLLLIYIQPWFAAIGILISIYLMGILSFRYIIGVKKTISILKVNIWKLTKNRKWTDLKNRWNNIVEDMSQIIDL